MPTERKRNEEEDEEPGELQLALHEFISESALDALEEKCRTRQQRTRTREQGRNHENPIAVSSAVATQEQQEQRQNRIKKKGIKFTPATTLRKSVSFHESPSVPSVIEEHGRDDSCCGAIETVDLVLLFLNRPLRQVHATKFLAVQLK